MKIGNFAGYTVLFAPIHRPVALDAGHAAARQVRCVQYIAAQHKKITARARNDISGYVTQQTFGRILIIPFAGSQYVLEDDVMC